MEDLKMLELIKQSKPVVCEKCGNQAFVGGLMFRRVSRLLTGDTEDTVLKFPVLACSACGHVNKEFMPDEIRGEEKPESSIITQ